MPSIDYLRISLIDRCNFRCQYCMPEDQPLTYDPPAHLLHPSELVTLVSQVFIPLGFRRFRLTGGEPLLRSDVVEIVADLARLPGVEDLSLTTNGFLLADLAADLYRAGLRRINVSLDSLNPRTFHRLIGYSGTANRWGAVWAGLEAAQQVGFAPIKVNVVVIPGVNDHEVLDLAALTLRFPWHIRFIEFMPIGNDHWFEEKGWIDSATIREQLRQHWGTLEPVSSEVAVTGGGPADYYQLPGALGSLGFISQMSECFCDRCNRIRLSADGWLRPCLLNETGQLDLKSALRSHPDPQQLQAQVRTLLHLKEGINFKDRNSGTSQGRYQRTMSQIGG